MAKKSFRLNANVAKSITQSVKTVSAHKGELNYNFMELKIIEPDPTNPRRLSISLDDISKEEELLSDRQKKELEKIKSLAATVKKVGVRNAIEVYKFGEKYKIISGERRWLASHLAEKDFIPVHICDTPKELDLKYLQWIENMQREGLTLRETYINLVQISKAYKKQEGVELSAKAISEFFSTSRKQSYRLFNLLNANKIIIDAVENEVIKTFAVLDALFKIKDVKKLEKMINDFSKNNLNKTKEIIDFINLNEQSNKKTPEPNKGRPKTRIQLGVIKNPNVAKNIFEVLLSGMENKLDKTEFENVDWKSIKSINNAFKRMVNILEQAS